MLEKILQLFVKTIYVGLNIEKLINIQNKEYTRPLGGSVLSLERPLVSHASHHLLGPMYV